MKMPELKRFRLGRVQAALLVLLFTTGCVFDELLDAPPTTSIINNGNNGTNNSNNGATDMGDMTHDTGDMPPDMGRDMNVDLGPDMATPYGGICITNQPEYEPVTCDVVVPYGECEQGACIYVFNMGLEEACAAPSGSQLKQGDECAGSCAPGFSCHGTPKICKHFCDLADGRGCQPTEKCVSVQTVFGEGIGLCQSACD